MAQRWPNDQSIIDFVDDSDHGLPLLEPRSSAFTFQCFSVAIKPGKSRFCDRNFPSVGKTGTYSLLVTLLIVFTMFCCRFRQNLNLIEKFYMNNRLNFCMSSIRLACHQVPTMRTMIWLWILGTSRTSLLGFLEMLLKSVKSSQVNYDHRKQAWKPLFPAITKDFTNNITTNNFYHTET